MKRAIGWFVLLLVLSTGITVWWNFGGREAVSSLRFSLPVFGGRVDDIDYKKYENFDIPEDDPLLLDPKEISYVREEEDPEVVAVVASYDPLIEYRLARDIARENARIGLERLANSGSVDASIELLNQTRNVSKEEELESILKAKGFGDTVITIEDNMVKVIAKDLSKQKVEAIAEIIYNLTTFGKDQIVLTSI
jgi:hypothetical protein